MNKWLLNTINNIKLRYKLAIIYLITGILPIVILFSFSYFQMNKILLQRDRENLQNFLQQSVTSVDGQLEIYNNLSNYISFNETISRIVSYDYKSEYELYNQLVQTFDPMVSSLKYFHDDVNRVTIYTDGDIKHDTTIAPVSEIEDELWYKAASSNTKIQWFANGEDNSLISARRMPIISDEKILGIMYINVDYKKVFSAFEDTAMKNYGIIILDESGQRVYDYNCFDRENTDNAFLQEKVQNPAKDGGWKGDFLSDRNGFSVMRKTSPVTGWTTYIYEPKSVVISFSKPVGLMIAVAAVVAVLGSVSSIFFTSRFITGRIKKLEANMRQVENGDFNLMVTSDARDEIGELIQGFGKMLDQINNLINQVYEGKINQKEYEMRALRAQINPHFLYNSLSLINWKAIEYGQEDISGITLALSNYYRTSLNKGKNTLTIEMELMNMNSYLEIQKVMHDNTFDVQVDVDKELYPYETLNLILQPLIENAIDHGIDLKTDGRGKITVSGYFEKENALNESLAVEHEKIVCLVIEDNGVGMDKNAVKEMLSVDSKGYGARNVNERIKLYYGEQYNLKVESTVGLGTRVTIRFPARMYTA
ncbi:MAG: sensor histidine kinase [Eubacteriales bacterium]|nr:sensor histidine kinase [Eubacteriales bacterium]